MSAAQLLNPKAFAKEQAKATAAKKKRTPNYGEWRECILFHMRFAGLQLTAKNYTPSNGLANPPPPSFGAVNKQQLAWESVFLRRGHGDENIPREGTAAWKSRSLPPMELMARNAACRAGPMALSEASELRSKVCCNVSSRFSTTSLLSCRFTIRSSGCGMKGSSNSLTVCKRSIRMS